MAKQAPAERGSLAAPAQGSLRVETAIREQQRLLAAAAGVLETAGAEDVHQGRVAARRLRSLLKTFGPLLEPRRARLYRVDLRSFARALAVVREADVRRDMLLALGRGDPSLTAVDRRRLGVLLDDHCIAARDGLRRHLREPGWGALRRALERHATGGALFAVRDAGLESVFDLVRTAWRRPLRMLKAMPEGADELHALRLSLKHCRYALEPLADIESRSSRRLMRRLRAAQDAIGEHRDTLLAGHWVHLNERSLGRPLTARLAEGLARAERRLLRRAIVRSRKIAPAWREWSAATRRVRRGSKRSRA